MKTNQNSGHLARVSRVRIATLIVTWPLLVQAQNTVPTAPAWGSASPPPAVVPQQQAVPPIPTPGAAPPLQQQQPYPAQQPLGTVPGAAPALPVPAQASQSRRHANRPSVTIRQFRSSVPEVTAAAATDVFMTALVETGKFRVLERLRMNEGINQEKQLNAQGATDGNAADVKLVSAKYIFEGTVSEAQVDQNATSVGLSVMGLGGKKTYTRDTIGIDVRVIEVDSGIVADAIKVRRKIEGTTTEAGGIGDALTNVLSSRFLGGAVQAAGNKEYQNKDKESLDNALRLAIEEAVKKIAERFADE